MQNIILSQFPAQFSNIRSQQENQDYSYNNQMIYEPEYFLNLSVPDTKSQYKVQIDYNCFNNLSQSPHLQDNDENAQCFNNSSTQLGQIESQQVELFDQFNNGYQSYLKEENIYLQKQQKEELQIIPQQIEEYSNMCLQSENNEHSSNNSQYYEDTTVNLVIRNIKNSKSLEKQEQIFENSEEKKAKNQNILKNIINAFQKYVNNLRHFKQIGMEDVEYSKIKKQFNRYMKVHTFNHSIIRYILTHKNYKILALSFFSEGHFDSWVNSSKISNKDEIKSWASFLQNCISDSSLLQCLTIYQSHKNKKEIF